MEWLNKIPQWIQIPLKILLPSLAIFSGFIMFASENLLKTLYLLQFREENGFAFGLIFVICASLIICYIGGFIITRIIDLYQGSVLKKKQYKLFINLADVYKQTLVAMYKSPTHSLKMEVSNSVAAYLEAIHAIGRSSVSSMGMIFDFYLQPWVVKSIEKMCVEIEEEIVKLKKKLETEKDISICNEIKENIQKGEETLKYIKTQTEDDADDGYVW